VLACGIRCVPVAGQAAKEECEKKREERNSRLRMMRRARYRDIAYRVNVVHPTEFISVVNTNLELA